MFPQEAESKYKVIITGYGVDDTSEGKNIKIQMMKMQAQMGVKIKKKVRLKPRGRMQVRQTLT